MSDRCEPTPPPEPPLPLPEAPEAEPTDVDPEVEPLATVFPAGSYAARVVADGATAYWRLGEASGTVANDAIGVAHGTIAAGVTLAHGGAVADGNKAMLFHAGSENVQIPTLTIPLVCTIEGWMNYTGTGAKGLLGTRFEAGATGDSMNVGISLGFVPLVQNAAGASVLGTTVVTAGVWHHLVYVLNGSTVLFYVDGVFDRSQALVRTVPNVTTMKLAAMPGVASLTGVLDEVAIYPTALSASTIAAHYALRSWYPPFTPGSYPARVVADGASHFWRLGDGAGTQATEVLAGAHGTISGGVTLNAAGALLDGDKSMAFNGTTGKIATVATVLLPAVFTLDGWIRTTQATGFLPIVSTPFTGSHYHYSFRVSSGQLTLIVWDSAVVQMVSAHAPVRVVADGLWHHIAFVFPGGLTFQTYIDGALDATGTLTHAIAADAQPVELGWLSNGAGFFPGSLDEVAIYPTALSAATIAAHYALRAFPLTGYPATVIQAGASNYWRLGESAGTTAVDIISGANGTISGGVTLGQPGGVPGDTSMVFNGSTGKVQTVASVPVPLTVTVEAWVTMPTVLADYRVVWSQRFAGTTGSTFVILVHGGIVEMYGGAAAMSWGRLVADGRWHHLACVLNGTTATLYVDGTVDASGPFARATPTTGPAALGWEDPANGTVPWTGALDEIAIYPRALAPSEVAAHYAAGTTLGPGDTTTMWRKWQDANQAFNNEEHAALLGGYPPNDLTTQLSRFLWGSYGSTQNPDAAHSRYQNMVLADGASHFWRLSDIGTTAVDIAGGVSGTLSGGVVTGAAGAFSGDAAMTFDGVDDKVVTASPIALLTPYTIECWFKASSVALPVPFVSNRQGYPTQNIIQLKLQQANGVLTAVLDYANSTSPEQILGVGVNSANGQWHHAVVVVQPLSMALYLDGAAPATQTLPATFAGASVVLDFGKDQFDGFAATALDNVAVYPRALSAAEVARHYAARG